MWVTHEKANLCLTRMPASYSNSTVDAAVPNPTHRDIKQQQLAMVAHTK